MHLPMSSEYAIKAERLGKCFQSYDHPVHRLVQALYKDKKKLYEEFWALREVTVQVKRGETVGIIGKNGSGKSTLLQLIAGTLAPSQGSIDVAGRISAILELGAGFNPEFTGVENARLNAAILGMSRNEIDSRLPKIIEFSELGEFINRPVKTYSSGMYIRLAFSISINLQPEILIIDEALAVGDVKFQRKCFRKLEQMRNDGVTILFVTHATDSVVGLCDRALFLDAGKLMSVGDPKHVVNQYLESLFFAGAQTQESGVTSGNGETIHSTQLVLDPAIDNCKQRATYNKSEYRWGNSEARIVDYVLLGEDEREISTGCHQGEQLRLLTAVYFEHPTDNLVYGFTIKTIDGAAVFGTNSELKKTEVKSKRGKEISVVEFTFSAHLIPGEYFISLGIVKKEDTDSEIVLDRRYDLVHLKIEEEDRDAFGVAAVDIVIKEQNGAQ